MHGSGNGRNSGNGGKWAENYGEMKCSLGFKVGTAVQRTCWEI